MSNPSMSSTEKSDSLSPSFVPTSQASSPECWAGDGNNLQFLRERQQKFARDRDWDQYHQPRNIALALVGEVGEKILKQMRIWSKFFVENVNL